MSSGGSEHPNATKIRALANSFTSGDLETVLNSYTDDGIYRVGGNNLVSGSYQGKQAMLDFFAHLWQVTEGTMRIVAEDVIGADNHAVMFWTGTVDRS